MTNTTLLQQLKSEKDMTTEQREFCEQARTAKTVDEFFDVLFGDDEDATSI